MRSAFRDLGAYSAAASLAADVYRIVTRWPPFDQWTIGTQLVRSADSVGANIAEASGRWQPADKKRLLVIARGSLRETEHWVATAAQRGLIDEEDFARRMEEIAYALAGLIRRQRR